jgi:DNA-binding MarR family transcriptional regulator
VPRPEPKQTTTVDESELNVLFPLFVCGGLSAALLQREIRGSGLTPTEFGVLSAIAVWGPLTPSDLATRAGLPPTTLSEYVNRFSKRRLVKRARHPEDGRSYHLELTAEGRKRHRLAGRGLHTSLATIAVNLDTEPKLVREALLALERALRASLTTKS